MVLIRKAGGLLGAGGECGLGWPQKALSGVLLEGREVRPVGFRLEADEQWDKLVLGHGWRGLVHPGLLPVVPPNPGKGGIWVVQGVALKPAAVPWNLLEVKILRLQPRPESDTGRGVGHRSVGRRPRGSDAWEDLRTSLVTPVM